MTDLQELLKPEVVQTIPLNLFPFRIVTIRPATPSQKLSLQEIERKKGLFSALFAFAFIISLPYLIDTLGMTYKLCLVVLVGYILLALTTSHFFYREISLLQIEVVDQKFDSKTFFAAMIGLAICVSYVLLAPVFVAHGGRPWWLPIAALFFSLLILSVWSRK